jgi:hypothetical protein
MFKRKKHSITRTLSGASYSLSVSGKRNRLWLIFIFFALAACAVFVFVPTHASPEVALRAQAEALRVENVRLAEQFKQQSMQLQHEQATREALERQLAGLAEDLKKARKDLSFYRGNAVNQGQ